MEAQFPILALELLLSGEEEKVDLIHIASQDVLDAKEIAFSTIFQRAEALASGKKVKKLIYQDDDGDWCTMSKTTIPDALTFMEMVSDMPEVGKLRVTIVTEQSDVPSVASSSASTAPQCQAPPSSPVQELTETFAKEALNAIGQHSDLRRVVPKLATRLLQIVRDSQQPSLLDLEPILQQFEEGSLKAEDVPSVLPTCIEAVRQLPQVVALALLIQAQAAADQVAKELAQEQPPSAVEVHPGITCDGCSRSPIIGKRYRSLVRLNYDFCDNCYQSTMQNANDWAQVQSNVVGDIVASFYGDATPQSMTHWGVECDGCSQFPLTGRRFKRVDANDYDLCERCHDEWMARPQDAGWRFEEVVVSTMTTCTQPDQEPAPPEAQAVASMEEEKPTQEPSECHNAVPDEKKELVKMKCADKCARGNCGFKPHTTQGHGFCCNSCKKNGTHGPHCEKEVQEELYEPLIKKLLKHPNGRVRDAVMQEMATVAGEALARAEASAPVESEQTDEAMEEKIKEIEPPSGSSTQDTTICQVTEKEWAMASEATAPPSKPEAPVLTAAVLAVSPPVLGIEAQEDQAGRGDVTEELCEQLQASGAQTAWRVGRIVLPVGLQADVPACAKFILKNDSQVAWPETACIASASGNPYGFEQMPLGAWQPNEIAEVVMDLKLPSRQEQTGERSAWAIVDAVTGKMFGPLILLDVFWQSIA